MPSKKNKFSLNAAHPAVLLFFSKNKLDFLVFLILMIDADVYHINFTTYVYLSHALRLILIYK